MLTCPRCSVPLRGVSMRRGPRTFACPSCAGRATTFEALRPHVEPRALTALFTATQAGGDGEGQRCPGCGHPMRAVHSGDGPARLDLDACPRCRLVWFDPTELGRFAPPHDPEPLADTARARIAAMPLEARLALARAQVEHEAEMAKPDLLGDAVDNEPSEPWQWIPAVLGLPYEVDRPQRKHVPIATWATAGVILMLGLWALTDARLTVAALGLVPAKPWRAGGLTWLTSLIVHGGLWHLASNLYFLMIAGDDVEEILGPWRWLALFLAAGLAGNLAHVLLDPRPGMPLVGASGAISGLLAFYALRFPGARLGITFRLYWRFAFLKIPVAAAVGLWLIVQVLGAIAQSRGCTSVSAFGHLGGFAVGVAAWAVTTRHRLARPERG